jgi:hypothetical protein
MRGGSGAGTAEPARSAQSVGRGRSVLGSSLIEVTLRKR